MSLVGAVEATGKSSPPFELQGGRPAIVVFIRWPVSPFFVRGVSV